jgi:hypothetical protein
MRVSTVSFLSVLLKKADYGVQGEISKRELKTKGDKGSFRKKGV